MIKLITHIDLDGVGCAILAKYIFGDNVEITYTDYDKVNDIMEKLGEYEEVYMTDISCDEKYVDKLTQLIDHHKTALHLNKYDNCKVEVERENGVLTCGTSLFADYLEVKYNKIFTVGTNLFISLVQYYDTWAWKEQGVLEANDLNTLFWAMGRERFVDHIMNAEEIFDEKARCILDCEKRSQENYINEKLKQVKKIHVDGYIFGFVFAEQYISALGDAMREHGYNVAVMFDICRNIVSFRSDDTVDVSELAKKLGGGGHKNASGAKVDFGNLLDDMSYKLLTKLEED